LIYHRDIRTPPAPQDRFRAGIDDAIILPLVLIALLARTLNRAALLIVSFAFDFVFILFLRMMTFPLLIAAVAGDGIVWLIKRLAAVLPQLQRATPDAWRDRVDRRWSTLRQRMSHAAVATAAQGLLQGRISSIFQRCGALSPRAALLVIAGAMLWLPVSAAISIAMHAVLLAKATSWPAWVQLLHPLATVIAKSKLLVLPAYPAAWPQARKHAWVQAAFRGMHRLAALDRIRKTAHRYRQTKQAFAQVRDRLQRAASFVWRIFSSANRCLPRIKSGAGFRRNMR